MNKKIQGVLLMLPLSLFMTWIIGGGLYIIIVESPFLVLGFFIAFLMILAFMKGVELVNDA